MDYHDDPNEPVASTSTPLLPLAHQPAPAAAAGQDADADGDGGTSRWHLKLTGYRLLITATTAAFGLSKAALAYAGQSTAPNTLDWVFGVVLTVGFYWLGLYESRAVLPWLFDTDYGLHIAAFVQTSFKITYTTLILLLYFIFQILFLVVMLALYLLLPGIYIAMAVLVWKGNGSWWSFVIANFVCSFIVGIWRQRYMRALRTRHRTGAMLLEGKNATAKGKAKDKGKARADAETPAEETPTPV